MAISNSLARGAAVGAFALVTHLALAAEGSGAAIPVSGAMAARQAALAATAAPAARVRPVAAPGGTTPADIFANPYRAYPPSCLGDGLPYRQFPQSSGDPAVLQKSVNLPGDPAACQGGGNTSECIYSEVVTVTVWRVACAANQSAVLLEIDRSAANENKTTTYPTFPLVAIQQNGNTLAPVRLAADPNTFFSTTSVNAPLISSDIFVLENYVSSTTQQIDYSKAFSLYLDNTLVFNVPAYDQSKYAAANLAMPISGYLSTNWFDPSHSGEGIVTQVYDNGDQATRTFTAAWYTFDNFGVPFWLYAQGSIPIGARSAANVATYYATNGGFAGNFGNATFTQWGAITVTFPDCNHMTFSFNGHTDAQTNGPGGSGTRTWQRLANVNSLVCN